MGRFFDPHIHMYSRTTNDYESMSKAGIIINIQKNLKLPIYFLGTGEKLDDLQIFNKKSFIENIFA